MSVVTYLDKRASDAVLSSAEQSSINTSISTLKSRLDAYFGSGLTDHFRFGSSTRGTILPRAMDEHSDIDYMVVFAERGYSTQTYLDRIRRFTELHYSRSDIKQSSPTIVLLLNHIRFDLVPALKEQYAQGYQIPNGTTAWQTTNPNDFNASLVSKNNAELSKIKPVIRLIKYWNAQNGYLYDSYALERWVITLSFSTALNLRDYLFTIFDSLALDYDQAQWRKDKLARAKAIVAEVRRLEREEMPYSAEAEVKKLIPE
jgi:predicted nucleotidyltransferase